MGVLKNASSVGVSICIAAYNTKDYIKRTLDSIAVQDWFTTNENYEILVGVDGDQELADYMKEIMGYYKNIRVFLMDSNRGSYVTSNTLVKLAKYPNIIRFDSDDIMYPNFVSVLMGKYLNSKYVMCRCKADKIVKWAHGCVFFKKDLFEMFGGFKPWPCSADTDMMKRIERFAKIDKTNDVIFEYVSRPTSLTHTAATSRTSETRQHYIKLISSSTYPDVKSATIKCETNTYVEIFPDEVKDAASYVKELRSKIASPKPKQSTAVSAMEKMESDFMKRSPNAVVRKIEKPRVTSYADLGRGTSRNRIVAQSMWSPVRSIRKPVR